MRDNYVDMRLKYVACQKNYFAGDGGGGGRLCQNTNGSLANVYFEVH